jgi:RNase P/RNase MRP subunit POP5
MAEFLRSISENTTLLTYNPEIMEGIIRCDHRSLNMVRRLLNTPIQDIVVTTLLTSGTLKALRNKLPELSVPKRRA